MLLHSIHIFRQDNTCVEVALNAFQPFGLPISKAIPDFNELLALHKANVEAYVHANATLAKGFEEIGKLLITFTQVECERAASAAKATLAVKSLPDAVALNTDYAKASLNHLVTTTTTLQEFGVKVAKEAIAPITARITVQGKALEKPAKPVATVEKQVMTAAEGEKPVKTDAQAEEPVKTSAPAEEQAMETA
jgi:phasin family protein